jgi:hypothetical protein
MRSRRSPQAVTQSKKLLAQLEDCKRNGWLQAHCEYTMSAVDAALKITLAL